jgi:hypothetical protein
MTTTGQEQEQPENASHTRHRGHIHANTFESRDIIRKMVNIVFEDNPSPVWQRGELAAWTKQHTTTRDHGRPSESHLEHLDASLEHCVRHDARPCVPAKQQKAQKKSKSCWKCMTAMPNKIPGMDHAPCSSETQDQPSCIIDGTEDGSGKNKSERHAA